MRHLGARGRWIGVLVALAIAWPATALFLRRFTDTDVPWWDAFPTAASVVGQWLLGRKYVENWPVWIVVNVVGVGALRLQGAVADDRCSTPSSSPWPLVGWRAGSGARRERSRRHERRGFVVALLGAESTGKTTLAAAIGAALAARGLRVAVVGEALREFCDRQRAHAAPRRAGGDRRASRRGASTPPRRAHEIVVADTSALMIAVYSDFVFGDTSLYAERARARSARYDLTLVTALDLPWQRRRPAARRRARARAGRRAAARRARARAAIAFTTIAGVGSERARGGAARDRRRARARSRAPKR